MITYWQSDAPHYVSITVSAAVTMVLCRAAMNKDHVQLQIWFYALHFCIKELPQEFIHNKFYFTTMWFLKSEFYLFLKQRTWPDRSLFTAYSCSNILVPHWLDRQNITLVSSRNLHTFFQLSLRFIEYRIGFFPTILSMHLHSSLVISHYFPLYWAISLQIISIILVSFTGICAISLQSLH